MSHADHIELIEHMFEAHGDQCYNGELEEPVSALAHALQCAQLAEWADASPTLVAAALLHDIGHFMAALSLDDQTADDHEQRAWPLLMQTFGPAVAEPVRLHVAAKRYLMLRSTGYAARLSPASQQTLAVQGGPMSEDEAAAFLLAPYAEQALALRRWDDQAKVRGKRTPPLSYYLVMLDQLGQSRPPAPLLGIGALDVS